MLIANSPVVLGDIHINDTKKFQAEVSNTSHMTSTITNIFVGCQSCTSVSMANRTIYSNETVKVNINFTPRTLGAHNKTVTLSYKTGDLESKVIINFTANVIR